MCCVYTAFLYQFFKFLIDADADYLDLKNPAYSSISCGSPDADCQGSEDPRSCMLSEHDRFWAGLNLSEALPSSCDLPPYTSEQCANVSLPLTAYHGDLGRLFTIERLFNPLRAWTALWGVITLLMIGMILWHDMLLLFPEYRPQILTRTALRDEFPTLSKCIRWIEFRDVMCTIKKKVIGVWVVLLPCQVAWTFCIYVIAMYPLLLISFLRYPRKLSRIMVFHTGILSICWSLICVVYTAFIDNSDIEATDLYTIFWNRKSIQATCVCYCQYPLKGEVVTQVVLLSSLTCICSFGIAFRALKGLRLSNWASLLSVTYVVPIESFPVRWERPVQEKKVEVTAPEGVAMLGLGPLHSRVVEGQGGWLVEHLEKDSWAEEAGIREGDELVALNDQSVSRVGGDDLRPEGKRPLALRFVRRTGGGPIRFRTPGEDVQGEPAFDPFCLMDEQPESCMQAVHLVPAGQSEMQRARWCPKGAADGQGVMEIGCCGFPKRRAPTNAGVQHLDCVQGVILDLPSGESWSTFDLENPTIIDLGCNRSARMAEADGNQIGVAADPEEPPPQVLGRARGPAPAPPAPSRPDAPEGAPPRRSSW